MNNSIKVLLRMPNEQEPIEYQAWQWNGQDFPPEEFQDFGYFEHDNGYDLESCTQHFICDLNRKNGHMRLDDWALKSKHGQFSICSPQWFRDHMYRPEDEVKPIVKRTREEIEKTYEDELKHCLNKTRAIKYPEFISDPMERRIYFSNETLMKAHQEAFEHVLDTIYGKRK